MKKFTFQMALLLTILGTTNSCITPNPNRFSISTLAIDLKIFEEEGIFATTGDYYEKYNSIAIVAVQCYEGYVQIKKGNYLNDQYIKDDLYELRRIEVKDREKDEFEFRDCKYADMIDELLLAIQNLGADGIIKLEIKNISRDGLTTVHEDQDGIEISGLAINITK